MKTIRNSSFCLTRHFLIEAVLETLAKETTVSIRVDTEEGNFFYIDLKTGKMGGGEYRGVFCLTREAYQVKHGIRPITNRNEGPITVCFYPEHGTIMFSWEDKLQTGGTLKSSREFEHIHNIHLLS